MGARPPAGGFQPATQATQVQSAAKPPVLGNPVAQTTFQPLWSGKNPDASNWTRYAEDAINAYGSSLLRGSSDIASFCPMYSRLGHTDQMSFWLALLSDLSQFESSFNPTSLYVETTMGIDPVTHMQVVSAGLFQLSYQDEGNYRNKIPAGVCHFDYAADSKLAQRDPRRTILRAKTNIECAVAILNYQVAHYGPIAMSSNVYWSTLKTGGRYNKLSSIRTYTKGLSFCK